jgi:hypothetical protein
LGFVDGGSNLQIHLLLHDFLEMVLFAITQTTTKESLPNKQQSKNPYPTNNKQQTTNNKQQTTNNKQQTTNNKQQTTNNKQQTTKSYNNPR